MKRCCEKGTDVLKVTRQERAPIKVSHHNSSQKRFCIFTRSRWRNDFSYLLLMFIYILKKSSILFM